MGVSLDFTAFVLPNKYTSLDSAGDFIVNVAENGVYSNRPQNQPVSKHDDYDEGLVKWVPDWTTEQLQ